MYGRIKAALRLAAVISLGSLAACSPAPAEPPGNPNTIYRTTEGGTPLSWELKFWTPDKSQLLGTIRNDTTADILGGFRWQLTPHGDTGQLEFSGRNDRSRIPPRAVLSLVVDGQAAFYGIVPDPPSSGSPDAESIVTLGGREALRVTLMDGQVYREQGVFQIVRDLLSRLTPPALTYLPALVGDGSGTDAGPTLSTYYSPTADLVTVLDGLAKSAGVQWGVDVQGRVFFGRPQAAALKVAYAGQPWRRLRVQGRETVTRAVLRVISAPGGGEPRLQYASRGGQPIPYLPATVTSIATHPQHGLYRANGAFSAPEGVSLLRDLPTRFDSSGTSVVTTPDAAVDRNPDTYATNAAAGSLTAVYKPVGPDTRRRVVGARITYTLTSADNAELYLRYTDLDVSTQVWFGLPQQELPGTMVLIAPPHVDTAAAWLADVVVTGNPTKAADFRIHELTLLEVDEDAAARTARTFLQLPFALPAEVTLDDLVLPSPTLTVTGSPDGDVTGPTGLFEYQHDEIRPRTTKVRLGSTGQSETARAIRFVARDQR